MKKIAIFSLLLIASSILASVEVVDLPKQPQNLKDLFQEALDEYHAGIAKKMEEEVDESMKQLEQLVGAKKNACIGGTSVNAQTMSPKSYMTAFNNGPCAPTVFIPGISGSKLIVEIDCETFKTNHPADFNSCFSTCTGSKRPLKEYQVWIPKVGSPMSIVNVTGAKRDCFVALIGFDLNKLSSTKNEMRKGLKVYPMGASPMTRTKSQSNCAFSGIEDMVPFPIQVKGFDYFKKLRIAFETAGYRTGLTMQALPYDFRLSYKDNSLNHRFKGVIKELYENTGKKVMIVAHSFGNFQTINNLWKMSQSEKDMMIARYIGLAPPYLGSGFLASSMIGYHDEYMVSLYITQLGVTPKMFKDGLSNDKGIWNLLPRDTYSKNISTDWMKAIFSRMDAEKSKRSQARGTVMDIFPSPTQKCISGLNSRSDYCTFDFYDMRQIGLVNGQAVTSSNLGDILDKYGVSYYAKSFWEDNKDSRFDTLPNLGVQTNIVFSSTVKTAKLWSFKSDPRSQTSQFKVVKADYTYGLGDGSVITSAAITPGVKWANDFKNGVSGSKPVNFVEICSDYNQRTSVFSSGTSVSSNAYFGIKCQCRGSSLFKTDGSGCDHTKLVSDPFLVDFVLNSAIDNQKAADITSRRKFETKSDSFLSRYEQYCDLFYLN